MSRAAVYDALVNSPQLQALGLYGESSPGADDGTIKVAYDGEQRPSDVMFLVLRWETESPELTGDDNFTRYVSPFVCWVHMYREFSTDYNRIKDVIKVLDDIFDNMIGVDGSDGETVTMITHAERSRDLRDDGYQTICRSVQYNCLSRPT